MTTLCRPHPCSAWHSTLVADYRAARQAWETAREAYVAGAWARPKAEQAAFALDFPPPTFGAFLRGLAAAEGVAA